LRARSLGFHRVSPRQLLSNFLGTLVQVEGIVTKCARRHAGVRRRGNVLSRAREVGLALRTL
jgi:DNA replicative helicase MCM subunit Mcm2 (Cdc46/Mcm family)